MKRPTVDGTALARYRAEHLLKRSVEEVARAAGLSVETARRIESRDLGDVVLADVVAYIVRGMGHAEGEALDVLRVLALVQVPDFDLDAMNRLQSRVGAA